MLSICCALRWPASILQGLPGSALPHVRAGQAPEPVWLEHSFLLSPKLAGRSIVSVGLDISCTQKLGNIACALGEFVTGWHLAWVGAACLAGGWAQQNTFVALTMSTTCAEPSCMQEASTLLQPLGNDVELAEVGRPPL